MSQNKQETPSTVTITPRLGGGGASRFASRERANDTKGTLIKLWSYFNTQKRPLIAVTMGVLIQSFLLLLVPFLVGRTIDSFTAYDAIAADDAVDFGALRTILIVLLSVYLMSAVLSIFQGWTMAIMSQKIVQNMREALFAKLQQLPISFFDRRSHGEIMSRLTNDIDNVSSTISSSLTALINGVFTITGTFIMMIILSPILTAASLIIIPLVYLLTRFVAKKTKVLFKEQQQALGQLNGLVEESISGIEVVRAFNQEQNLISQFEVANQNLRNFGLKAMIYSGFLMPLMNVIANFGFAIIATLGSILAIRGAISIGIIAAFLTYSRQFSRPLNDIANIFNTLQSAVAGAERVFQIMEEQVELKDDPFAIAAGDFKGEVIFKQVEFGYEAHKPIVKELDFHVEAGKMVAIVGPTGAGKTTIVNLLTRFYELESGEILIDGKNINAYTRESLRQNFGMVLQDTYLFSGTIKENLRYGQINATDEEIIQAAKMAASHAFIKGLPDGYETQLIEGGSNISQGQRQLLAITRAILANPSILILDEATSNIDTRTEIRIQQALLTLMKGRTSFVIAHRLSTIREADMIMVIDNGQIKELGSHEQLLAQKGFYSQMYEAQTTYL